MTNLVDKPGELEELRRMLKLLDKHKTTAALGVTILYLLGYVGWSIHSLVDNIGPLPALDIQYVVTGAAIAIALVICHIVYRWLRRVPLAIEATIWRSSHSIEYMRWLKRFVNLASLITVPYVLAVLYLVWDSLRTPPHVFEPPGWFLATQDYVLLLLVAGGFAGWIVHIGLGLRETTTPVGILFNGPLFLSGILGILLLTATLNIILPGLPQPLGGFKPRCAYLFIEDSETVSSLPSPLFTRQRSEPPFLTDRLDVLYSNDDILIVRPESEKKPKFSYEVSKDIVASVEWCTGLTFTFGGT